MAYINGQEVNDAIIVRNTGGGVTPTGTINISENGTFDVTNYANANVNVASGDFSFELLCYGEQALQYEVGKNALNVTTYSNEYVEYDTSNRQFTVLKDFAARITAWVLNYQYSTNASNGQLIINSNTVASYQSANHHDGAKGGKTVDIELKTGDVIYVNTPNSNGYPTQRIKIYKSTSNMIAELNQSQTFENEQANS